MKYGQATDNFSKCQEYKLLKYLNPELDKNWNFKKGKKQNSLAVSLLESLEKKYDSPEPVFVFGIQVYLILLGWEKDKNKIRFYSYRDLKNNEKIFKICMETMLLSNKEREIIFSMIDIANRISDPLNPVNKNEKRQKRLTKLKNFDYGLRFLEIVSSATGLFDKELVPWRKLFLEKDASERSVKRTQKKMHEGANYRKSRQRTGNFKKKRVQSKPTS